MPTMTQDVVLYHQLEKDSDPVEIKLASGDTVTIVKEWSNHYLIKTGEGKLFNISKEYVDASG